MVNFETFTERMVPMQHRPYVSILQGAMLSLNRPSWALLDCPDAVELLFDRQREVLGLRRVDPGTEHAHRVRGSEPGSNSIRIAATAFIRHYGIDTTSSRRWAAYLDDDVLCLDLAQPGTEVTSNRRGRPASAR